MARTKTKSAVSAERVLAALRMRYAPIRNLTAERLATALDQFEAGYVREAALLFEAIERRDDVLAIAARKRKKAVARHGFDIVPVDNSPEAQRHAQILRGFYNTIQVTSAVDLNVRGGFRLLLSQMADAIGKRYSVHEIVWKPSAAFGVRAELRHVPLWFFENTTGRLRYLQTEGALSGIELAEGEWLISAGDGVMEPSSVCYLFKHMPLRDWLVYSERHGMPGLHGKTDAAKGSTEWSDLKDALENFGVDWALITNPEAQIEPVDVATRGQLPYPPLVDRMDRALSALWRGADLGTLSRGGAENAGASVQATETEILEADDAEALSETLNEQLDRWVLRYALGAEEPMAYIHVNAPQRRDVAQERQTDEFLLRAGVEMGKNDLRNRYGRSAPAEDDENVAGIAPPGDLAPMPNERSAEAIANERAAAMAKARGDRVAGELFDSSLDRLAMAQALVLSPLKGEVERILAIEDPEFFANALRNLQGDLPRMLIEMNRAPQTAPVLEEALSAALVNGWAEGAARFRDIGEEEDPTA
jgi:phage gp29-like protein